MEQISNQEISLMESKLHQLLMANSEENRSDWAKNWKKQKKKKVIGLLCSYVPEEIIYAAGMLPWRISGTWKSDTPNASVYRISTSCRFCNHVLESYLSGNLDFLDGVVSTNLDDDIRCLWDVWDFIGRTQFRHIMHLPHKFGDLASNIWGRSVKQFKLAIEDFSGEKIADEKLWEAINIYNKTRTLLKQLYDMRKREQPSVSGAEVLAITTASMVMAKEEFNYRLEELLPYLNSRKAPLKKFSPRLLVSSDMLDHPDYIKLIEDTGSIVSMDDLDTGSRYFWNLTEISGRDPLLALADRYLHKPESPRMLSWDDQIKRLIEWVREFKIDGVVDLPLMCSFPREFMTVLQKKRLSDAGIPNISLKIEYHMANVGQLKTRIGAFIEMLEMEG